MKARLIKKVANVRSEPEQPHQCSELEAEKAAVQAYSSEIEVMLKKGELEPSHSAMLENQIEKSHQGHIPGNNLAGDGKVVTTTGLRHTGWLPRK